MLAMCFLRAKYFSQHHKRRHSGRACPGQGLPGKAGIHDNMTYWLSFLANQVRQCKIYFGICHLVTIYTGSMKKKRRKAKSVFSPLALRL
jgi:hypothetical protein